MHAAFYVVLGHAAGAAGLGWLYFRRYRVARPPLGVLTSGDLAVLVGGVVLVPYLYLLLPRWVVAGLLAAGILSVLYVTWEPILRARWAIWPATLLLLGADVGAALRFGTASRPFFAVNNAVLLVAAVGIANLWAQSGMRARHVAALGVALALYDALATARLPLMADLLARLAGLPFAPLVAWPVGDAGRWLGIGLGDLLLATVAPLVMRKAFGRAAGLAALALAPGALGTLLALVDLGVVRGPIPAMVVLGPLLALQYGYWARRRGAERTTRQYLRAEPPRGQVGRPRRTASPAVEANRA
ncbi:MAG TPA: hypothetical protein VFW96_22215 [Thermomicrobiales bacterium]|nr:hypothetical protein [Thermomicrobiales bacterium]